MRKVEENNADKKVGKKVSVNLKEVKKERNDSIYLLRLFIALHLVWDLLRELKFDLKGFQKVRSN